MASPCNLTVVNSPLKLAAKPLPLLYILRPKAVQLTSAHLIFRHNFDAYYSPDDEVALW